MVKGRHTEQRGPEVMLGCKCCVTYPTKPELTAEASIEEGVEEFLTEWWEDEPSTLLDSFSDHIMETNGASGKFYPSGVADTRTE